MVDLLSFWPGALQRLEQYLGHVWTQAPLTVLGPALMTVLAAVEAALLWRTQTRLRHANSDLAKAEDELTAIRDKYEREVHWRRAAERVAADKRMTSTASSPTASDPTPSGQGTSPL